MRKAQQCLLSLLVLNKVFFPHWCLTGSPFPAVSLQISFFKILPWPNKMVAGHKTHKMGGLSSNTSLVSGYGENAI